MIDTSLFAGNDKQPAIDPNKDYYPELVGENAKFKTNQDLARAKVEADFTIDMMKQRMDEMRADLKDLHETRQAGASIQELIDQLKTQKPSDGNFTPNANDVNDKPAIKADDIERLVSSRIQEHENSKREQANLSVVQQKLRERYGNNYAAVLSDQREKLGLTAEQVDGMAKQSPEGFFRLMGLSDNQTQGFQAPPRSSSNTNTFTPNSGKRTWTYYQDLKKQDKALYYSPKMFNQMLRDAEELGPAFKDGDYSAFGD